MHTAQIRIFALLAVSGTLGAQTLNKPGASRAERSLFQVLQPSEAELADRVTPVVRAVRATSDSVVSVYIEAAGRYRVRTGNGVEGQGSGVILDRSGLVITNWHVVARAVNDENRRVRVYLKTGKEYEAKILSTAPEYDLALMQLELPDGEEVQPVTAGDSDSLMIGETVIAIGNPKGHANTVTVGVLSADDRSISVRTPDGVRNYTGLLQTDAAINQGNSGGALLDITGRLIGINNAMSVNSENIGFAIPVNTVRRVFNEVLLSSENLASVYLGIQIDEQDNQIVLTEVAPDSPADRAGLAKGDQLLGMRAQPIRSKVDYARALLETPAQKPLSLTILRRGREMTLRPIPISNASRSIVLRTGIEFERVTDAAEVQRVTERMYQELSEGRPSSYPESVLRVTHVRPDSPGDRAEFRKGDVLLGIVEVVREFWQNRTILHTYATIKELDDSLHVLVQRQRNPEANVWILRDDEVWDGPLRLARP